LGDEQAGVAESFVLHAGILCAVGGDGDWMLGGWGKDLDSGEETGES
jgi:hypothetical protein